MYERFQWNAASVLGGADNDVAAGVLNALYWDLAVPRDCLIVTIENSWVTLAGEVERPYERSCAEADVRRVRGIVGVNNQIVLRVTLLHGGCEARVGAGERSITRHGRRWLARDRAYD